MQFCKREYAQSDECSILLERSVAESSECSIILERRLLKVTNVLLFGRPRVAAEVRAQVWAQTVPKITLIRVSKNVVRVTKSLETRK